MRIIFFTVLVYLVLIEPLSGSQIMKCKTKKQSGLDFIGKDHEQIINSLGLKDFSIRLSRTREEIVQYQINLNKLKSKPSKLKRSFFRNYCHEI